MSSCCFYFLVALFESKVLDVVGNEGDDVVSGECGMFSVIFSKSYASIYFKSWIEFMYERHVSLPCRMPRRRE